MKVKENPKAAILDWFQSDRDFETGKQLFFRHGQNLSFKTTLNRIGNSPSNYSFLCYELAKIAGIPEMQYKAMLKTALVSSVAPAEESKQPANTEPLTIEEMAAQIELVDVSTLEWPQVQQMAAILELKPASRKKKDMIAALQEAKTKKFVSVVPDNIKRAIKLRDEFPFLKQKTCPGVLKELVADMLTAYDAYIESHGKLVEGASGDEIAELSKSTVENYLENREIWAELNHFKTTGELLGKHPIFDWMKRKAEIHAMKDAELVILRDQLKNKIPRTKKQIADEPDHKETAKRVQRVEQFEQELVEVNTLLGINE
jgi:hypothetical protein